MSVEQGSNLDQIIAASTSIAELFDNVERAGGIKKSNGEYQNLNILRDAFLLTPNMTLEVIKSLLNILPHMLSGVTKNNGLRQKLEQLYLKELSDKKKKLEG